MGVVVVVVIIDTEAKTDRWKRNKRFLILLGIRRALTTQRGNEYAGRFKAKQLPIKSSISFLFIFCASENRRNIYVRFAESAKLSMDDHYKHMESLAYMCVCPCVNVNENEIKSNSVNGER